MDTNLYPVPANDTAVAVPATQEADDLILKFAAPYTFEGKTIREVDLSGLADVTAQDMVAADKYMSRTGSVSAVPEMTVGYACFMASHVTPYPVEFFLRLKSKDAIKLKNIVTGFFFADE